MKLLKYTFALALAASLSTACTKDEAEGGGVYAGKNTTVYVSSEAGSYDFKIETTGSWSAAPVNSGTKAWTSFEGKSAGTGKGLLTVRYRANTTFPREGRIAVKLAEALVADTIIIRQYGVQPTIEFRKESTDIFPVGGSASLNIATNLSGSFLERLTVGMTNVSGSDKEWITEGMVSPEGTSVSYEVARNTDADRTADLVITFTDDWGVAHKTACRISQVSMGETEQKTFEQIRAMVTDNELTIDKNYIIDGIVVSDCLSANVAANPNTSKTAVDYTKNGRTTYLQGMDGKYGFMIEYAKEGQNPFSRYDHITVSLNGAHIAKLSNPERYVISNITENAIFGWEKGSSQDLPVKELSIDELTADDLYTLVTLKQCEFPVRKGSYTPINEGYAYKYDSKDNQSRVDMYPLVVRDSKGGHIHLMTNLKAPWRRDGNPLPQGAGKLSGVVVNEPCKRFEQDGNIGQFQIRAIEQSDIALEKDASKSYSKIIAAWVSKPTITNGVATATIGSGELSHTSAAISSANDFSLLGPITGKQEQDNKGVSSGTGWKSTAWWDAANNCGESWVAKFSTAGITAKYICLTFCVMNQSIGAPRYWAVEWSDHGQKLGAWNRVAEYTVPDVVQWGNTLEIQTAGHKNISVELPTQILGKQNVYIRLTPTSTKAGTADTYDGGTYSGSKEQQMSYLAIQYND